MKQLVAMQKPTENWSYVNRPCSFEKPKAFYWANCSNVETAQLQLESCLFYNNIMIRASIAFILISQN